ncbi:MAG: hypothetical protein LUQ36_06240 [Methanoregula sp.]|nr:hypothetical protein [Methanoregula sp.]
MKTGTPGMGKCRNWPVSGQPVPHTEECRKNLIDVIDGWIVIRLKRGLPIPPIDNHR